MAAPELFPDTTDETPDAIGTAGLAERAVIQTEKFGARTDLRDQRAAGQIGDPGSTSRGSSPLTKRRAGSPASSTS